MPTYSRAALQRLANDKLDDALLLSRHGRHASAFYLGGYAVELGLKAALTRQFTVETLPDRKFVNDAYTHRLTDLVRLAGLSAALRDEVARDADFAANWGVVSRWDEASRYELIDASRSVEFLDALSDPQHGVFPWVTMRW